MANRLADRETVSALLRQGKQHKEISAITGASVSTVAKIACEQGLQTRRNTQYVVLTAKDWEDITFRIDSGESISELSKEYGTSRAAIYAKLKKRSRK